MVGTWVHEAGFVFPAKCFELVGLTLNNLILGSSWHVSSLPRVSFGCLARIIG